MLVKEMGGMGEKRLDPRVRRTRELIVGAFNDLVAEKGHTGLTVQEIAERATINRATFYAHFADQYELFDYAISEAFREELRRRLPDLAGPSEENLKALVLAACDYLAGLNTACTRTDRQFRPLIEARVQGELYEVLLGWIKGSPQVAGGWRASPEVTASVASWAIFGAALDWSRNGATLTPDEVADQTLKVIVEGLQL
jgi:AcrR family transcriptional regulator